MMRLSNKLKRRLPLLKQKGFVLDPPITDLAIEEGDTFTFTYNREMIICVYDGSDWRYVGAMPCGMEDDFDPDVVTIL